MAVGEALLAGRTIAMQAAETNRPEGKAYNQILVSGSLDMDSVR